MCSHMTVSLKSTSEVSLSVTLSYKSPGNVCDGSSSPPSTLCALALSLLLQYTKNIVVIIFLLIFSHLGLSMIRILSSSLCSPCTQCNAKSIICVWECLQANWMNTWMNWIYLWQWDSISKALCKDKHNDIYPQSWTLGWVTVFRFWLKM